MREVIRFIIGRLMSRAFWLLFATSFMGMLMYELRGSFKDQIFQSAIADLKSRNWPNWK